MHRRGVLLGVGLLIAGLLVPPAPAQSSKDTKSETVTLTVTGMT
jgi:hypothetical protein